ncbi:ATP-binding protein [Eubacterium pyruvativorans]|uniref:ATP-binding protein n=1 Tax=Eubacterium pyruvativorans TaxID=155865 RepID=UPI0015A4D9EE|nr:ATP-binding protein [Eubacterium pyruvativorans]
MIILKRLLTVEAAGKQARRTEKLRSAAGFESEKPLENIDYGFNHSLDRDKIEELGRLDFLEAKEIDTYIARCKSIMRRSPL